MNNFVEVYDPLKSIWTIVDYSVTNLNKTNFNLMAYSAGVQINAGEIYLFGGSENETISNMTYIFKSGKTDNKCEIHVNNKCLPTQGIFWNNFCIINNRKLFALQNV